MIGNILGHLTFSRAPRISAKVSAWTARTALKFVTRTFASCSREIAGYCARIVERNRELDTLHAAPERESRHPPGSPCWSSFSSHDVLTGGFPFRNVITCIKNSFFFTLGKVCCATSEMTGKRSFLEQLDEEEKGI